MLYQNKLTSKLVKELINQFNILINENTIDEI